MKYFLDRVLALLLLILLSPLLLLISFVIRIEGGPVFFKQRRPGLGGELFSIWKFRTMVVNADALLDNKGHLMQRNRITKIGRVLRYLSLDELPQLINILKGEMSFIGPRPALPEHLERYSDEQKLRFGVKPGITGLAQIHGRNTLKWSKRIEYDLAYIHDYSLSLDLKILLRTIKIILSREGIVLDRNPDQVDDLPNAKSRQNIL